MKLRLTQPRSSDPSEPFDHDLRGLGDHEFLNAGFPVSRLVVCGERPFGEREKRILQRYALVPLQIDRATTVLTAQPLQAHAHKRNSVSLFVAALELGSASGSEYALLLEEVRPFNALLREAFLKDQPLSTDLSEVVASNVDIETEAGMLEVSSSCVRYLEQAGVRFERMQADGSIQLDRQAREAMVSALIQQSTSRGRKAA